MPRDAALTLFFGGDESTLISPSHRETIPGETVSCSASRYAYPSILKPDPLELKNKIQPKFPNPANSLQPP